MEPGTTHEEIDSLHPTPLLHIASGDASESPVATLVGKSSPLLIVWVRK